MKRPGIALILGSEASMKKSSKSEEGSDSMEAFEDAALECFSALKDGDRSRFVDSLKDAIKICTHSYDSHDKDDY